MRESNTASVAVGLVIIVIATVAVSALLIPMDEPEPIAPVDTPPPTVFTVTNLPPPLTQEATITVAAARGPAIQVSEPPPAPTTIPIPPHYETWIRLAECESGGDWGINTGNGYYGGLQFTLTSWNATGGWQVARYPHQADPLEQMWAAEVLLTYQGWNAWPGCKRKLGL